MKIRKFEAAEVSEALRAIREELGPDAVILSTREFDTREPESFGRKRVEVTAAVEFPSPSSLRATKEQSKFDQIFQELIPKIEKGEEILSIREELKGIREAIQYLQTFPRLDKNQFYGRLYEICTDVRKVSSGSQPNSDLNHFHESFIHLYDRLILNGVDHRTATGLVKLMNEKISPGENNREDYFKLYLEEIIKGMVQKISECSPVREEPTVTVLVGPSGVGKTTTLAKLAARKILKNQKAIMATLDISRVGAIAQLNAFGKIIGAPVYAASSVGELKVMISKKKKADFIFIDTPGHNYSNIKGLFDLGGLKYCGFPLHTQLVLSAHTRQEELDDMVDRFSGLSVDHFIFTKTDETRRFGHLLTMMKRRKRPISYLTMGQKVPDDIEVATPKRVAEMILAKASNHGEETHDSE